MFNWHGYEFQDGLKVLERSFSTASEALQRELDAAYSALDQHDVEYGDDSSTHPDTEFTDNGYVLFDPRDHLAMNTLNGEQAVLSLRKAFVIMLYHHWERCARDVTDKRHGGFRGLAEGLQNRGMFVDIRLVDLLVLANTLKHDAPIWGRALFALRPDWFNDNFRPYRDDIDWYAAVDLSADDMTEIFAVVSTSGPDTGTIEWS